MRELRREAKTGARVGGNGPGQVERRVVRPARLSYPNAPEQRELRWSSEACAFGQKIAGAGRISSTPAVPVSEESAHGRATYRSRELKLNHPPGFAAGIPAGRRPIPNLKSSSKKGHAVRLQYGALPYHFTKTGGPEFLLVTTRKTKRWMIAKGWPIKGLKRRSRLPARRMRKLACGVRSGRNPSGSLPMTNARRWAYCPPARVRVFPLLVTRQDKTWPEYRQRHSQWFVPEEALSAVKEDSLGY